MLPHCDTICKQYSLQRAGHVFFFCSGDFWLEMMKGGQIIEERRLSEKSHFIFGRSERWDFFLEHPSISRQHAVIQFSAEGGPPTLYDCSSVHGTFLNKKRLKPGVWVPLRSVSLIPDYKRATLSHVCGLRKF